MSRGQGCRYECVEVSFSSIGACSVGWGVGQITTYLYDADEFAPAFKNFSAYQSNT